MGYFLSSSSFLATFLQLGGVLFGVLDLDQQLSGVGALVQVNQSLLSNLEAARENVLGLLDLALGNPLGKLLASLAVVLDVVEDDEALHLDAHADDSGDVAGTLGVGAVVLADATAHDKASVLLGAGKAHVEDFTTN